MINHQSSIINYRLPFLVVFLLICGIVGGNLYAQTADALRQQKQRQEESEKAALKVGNLNNEPNARSIHVNRNLTYRSYRPQQLVDSIFVKSGVCASVSNVTFQAHGWSGATWTHNDNRGLGYFSRGDSNFEFAEGLVLSTGGLVSIEGSNLMDSGVSNPVGSVMGDTDLQALVSQTVSNVSRLEFDFVPISNVIQFRYVFASEEYANYVSTVYNPNNYNDVFGFFISGPGISGTQNIALLPTTTSGNYVVSINNVNDGQRPYGSHNCPTHGAGANANYYVNIPGDFSNCRPLTQGEVALKESMEFNGRTVVLTATATVIPCETYHLKLAIANVGDNSYQSGVFLEAGSLNLGDNLQNYGNNIEGLDIVYRGCENNKIVISRSFAESTNAVVGISYGGTAVNGVDVSLSNGDALPNTVIIPANELSTEIFYAVNTPPTGSAVFTITIDCPCGVGAFTKTILIYDPPSEENFQASSSPSCPGMNNGMISISTGSEGSGYYESSIDGGLTWLSAPRTYTDLATGTYSVLIRDFGSCYDVLRTVIIDSLRIDAGSDQLLCSNEFTMAAEALAFGETGLWSVVSGTASIADPTSPTTDVTLSSESATLRWTLNRSDCQLFDEVVLTAFLVTPVITTINSNICSGGSITVTASTIDGDDTLMWYSDSLYSHAIAAASFTIGTLTADTTFYVEATGIYGCVSQDSLSITVTQSPRVMVDNLRLCYGDEITLTTIEEDGDISWSTPQTFLRLTASTYYIVTASRPPCPDVRDTLYITVGDSLYIRPPMLLAFDHNKYYEQQLQSNAPSPYFSVIFGQLPAGIVLHSDGMINGFSPFGQNAGEAYLFTVQLIDANGCYASIDYSLDGNLFAPVVFSPNDDGVNDYFMKGFRVVIYDRLGVKIFEGDDGWDGTYNDKPAPVDTYFYIVFYTDTKGRDTKAAGSITIVR
ncbi:MAG: gliding motility-associated C-terminal domain-containing protein [Bacteroidales bacterium]|nr:gliding motility-associated C-terminal domain-containing protein [Bacteroidales bacterium]MCL2133287.1 gliding motility-associated C-terminal domain-containing protein [Bacteroidales bacterium]